MPELTSVQPGIVLLAVPLLMLLVGMVPTRLAGRNPVMLGQLVQGAGLVGLALAVGTAFFIAAGNSSPHTFVVLGADPTLPSLLAIGTVLSVAVAQLLAASEGRALTLRLFGVSVAVTTAYFALHTLFSAMFTGDLTAIPSSASPAHYVLLTVVAAVFLALSWVQSAFIHDPDHPRVKSLYVHLYNGLYTDLPVERLVYRVWPARFRQ